jgi:GNAT superfamily N-acetyltransferase
MLLIRLALLSEHAALEALQWRASLVADEYRDALLAHPDAIALDPSEIEAGRVLVAQHQETGELLGFAAWVPRDDAAAELDGLFVEPARWRSGIGRRLVDAAAQAATAAGAGRLHVVANPAAVAFYAHCGFIADGGTQTRFGPAPTMVRLLRMEIRGRFT